VTLFHWCGRTLEARYQPAFDAGAPIATRVFNIGGSTRGRSETPQPISRDLLVGAGAWGERRGLRRPPQRAYLVGAGLEPIPIAAAAFLSASVMEAGLGSTVIAASAL
jgi:hypothetical protein